MIPFNKPHLTGNELKYIQTALQNGKFSGDGPFTIKAQALLAKHLKSGRSLLTTSCTDALEAAALLCDLKEDDEVIIPSYTFASTANAFALRGAKIRFADSSTLNPNMDPGSVESLLSKRTKAIVPVHYAGIACDMGLLKTLADNAGAVIIEDAAQAMASQYKGQPLGTFGIFSTFSFHETKNLNCGEGGALHVNDIERFQEAEIVREKGTNRSAFFRGEIDKYGWVGLGSSYLPSEITAAFLTAQLEQIEKIQKKRIMLWERYAQQLSSLSQSGLCQLPHIPGYATNNAHMFYLVCQDLRQRTSLINFLKSHGIYAAFHYQSLHRSSFYSSINTIHPLPNAERYSDCLVRLPLFHDLTIKDVDEISGRVLDFFKV